MKKLILSVVLVNLLAACAIHTPFDREAEPKKEPVAATPAPEVAKVDSATSPDVNAQTLNNTPTAETAAAADAAPKAEAAATAEAAPKAEVSVADPLNDPASLLSKRSVHFPFDIDAVQDSDKAIIQAHGAYLASHPERKIRVEGNADERGSSEYNLALGQRRANNTKKTLVLSGAKSDQIEAISFGEEKPLATGHDEAAWSQNRRADINYK
jgi:peptidoglycan-associated lipoprotein